MTFSSLLTPPCSLTAEEFVSYFTKKVKDISSSFTAAGILLSPIPTSIFIHFLLSTPKMSTE